MRRKGDVFRVTTLELNILCCRPVFKGMTYYLFTPFWDATSPPESMAQARRAALKKYANSLHFREQAKVFNSPSTVDDIVVAGENALVTLYGRKSGEKLDCMRYQCYCEKLATNSSQMQPQNLPPTSAAARHHSLRVYLQVTQWKGENEGIVTLLLLYPRGPLGHLIFSRASDYYANKTSSFLNSAATVKRTFFLFSSY